MKLAIQGQAASRFLSVCTLILIIHVPASADSDGDGFFERAVRPLLFENCIACHGPKTQKGGLRLDTKEGLLKGGSEGPVIIPGKPAESRILAAVKRVGELKMPPSKKLTDAEIGILEKWISGGAPWPKNVVAQTPASDDLTSHHWAFQPIHAHPIPQNSGSNPIDAFIQAKLAQKELNLSPTADRRTLLRRLKFDLLGLPPTPDEISRFEADASPDAYLKQVDRLLASPHYGERWARHWLDVARYADNKGYVFFEEQNYPWAWTYREYVISAFNRNIPFDQFVMEQIAADQSNLEDQKSLAALGFLTVGGHFMGNTHDIIDDRIDTITRGLMGLTVSCARCHDHKFDPVPQADYYSLYGIFRSSTEPTIPPLWGPPPASEQYKQFATELAAKEKQLKDFVIGKHKELVAQARSRVGDYLHAAYLARNQPPADDFMLISDKGDLNPAMIARFRAFLAATRKSQDRSWTIWHRFAELPESEFSANATKLIHHSTDNPLIRDAFQSPPKTMKEVTDRYAKILLEVEKTWLATGSKNRMVDADAEALRSVLYGPTAPADAPLSLDWGFLSLFPDRATQAEYQKLIKEVEIHAAKGPPRSMVLLDSDQPYDPRIFLRGQPNRLGESVPRQFLKVLEPKREPISKGSGRLEIAKSIASPNNPLTARVFINRIWMHHFGRGLVNTPGDFGLRGDPPTHPELLDWLASDFILNGWNIKRLHRQIVTSEVYQQVSLDHGEGFRMDPENRLLWKQNRRRLDFESLHDAMLAVGGNLNPTIGGTSFQFFTGVPRRAVYGFINRLEFPSLLATFDVPNPAATSAERTSTTVAPQALYLMNGPFARDAAKNLVNSSELAGMSTITEKVNLLFRKALGRLPTEKETSVALAYLSSGSQAERLLDLAHGLLMTNEFLFID
jgi:hypothetical protein